MGLQHRLQAAGSPCGVKAAGRQVALELVHRQRRPCTACTLDRPSTMGRGVAGRWRTPLLQPLCLPRRKGNLLNQAPLAATTASGHSCKALTLPPLSAQPSTEPHAPPTDAPSPPRERQEDRKPLTRAHWSHRSGSLGSAAPGGDQGRETWSGAMPVLTLQRSLPLPWERVCTCPQHQPLCASPFSSKG